jgi:hypothetical protein
MGADFGFCNIECDPTAPTTGPEPCDPSYQCVPLSVKGATTCVPTKPGKMGAACINLDDCAPGLVCAGQKCLQYCFYGVPGMCPAGKQCTLIQNGALKFQSKTLAACN